MNKYVLDASVILASLLDENIKVKKRLEVLLNQVINETTALLSSKFLAVEISNGLRFGTKDQKRALEVFNDFLKLPIKTLVPTSSQMKKSISKSYELKTTVYDTSYHILAKAQNARFLTCDDDYYKKAKELGDIELVS